ncbi:MAG: putative Ig domain-containing protein [Fibrobacterota bacterium]
MLHFNTEPDTISVPDEWNLLPSYARGSFTELTAQPPIGDYHDIKDWYYQRYWIMNDDQTNLYSSILDHRFNSQNWAGYDYLRFDVYSTTATTVIGVQVKDALGPSLNAGFLGLFTPTATFQIPLADTVTCNFPLAEMASLNELSLNKIQGYIIRVNGYSAATRIEIRNVRLVGGGTPVHTLVEMDGAVSTMGRRVCYHDSARRDLSLLPKNLAPVTSVVGPVTLVNTTGGYACANGHFGGSGATYFQNLKRGAVAYDNDRLVVLLDANITNARQSKPSSTCEGGGVAAMGSFDGGTTWGGITQGETRALNFTNWYWRSFGSSDPFTGDLYFIGTQNCASYHGNVDFFVRRVAFVGNGWKEDRFSILGQMYKCPQHSQVSGTSSGRIWATCGEGFGGVTARYSDDNGFVFLPAKDAALSGSTASPRPYYVPGTDPIPANILVFPGTEVTGPVLVPYNDGMAFINYSGTSMQIHDGSGYGSTQSIPAWGTASYNIITATVINRNHLFLEKGGRYDDGYTTEYTTDLRVAHCSSGGSWQSDILETANVTESNITASGNDVFCFYILKNGTSYEVRYFRWHNGSWGSSVLVSTETVRLNLLVAPMICPPTYAAIFWDQMKTVSGQSTFVKFARIPNTPDFQIATRVLPRATRDSAYSASIQAVGGTEPYSFAVTSGTLPLGLTLNANGTLSGTPTVSGSFQITVTATDASPATASQVLTVVVSKPEQWLGSEDLPRTLSPQAPLLVSQPNPFSGSAMLSIRLMEQGTVNLAVYDVRGKCLNTLFSGFRKAGAYQFGFQAKDLAPGVYFVRLTAGSHRLTRTLVFVR